jgi:hypothetical protein
MNSTSIPTIHTILPLDQDARQQLAALVDLASDLDALLEDHGRLPVALLASLRQDLQRAVDRLQHHHRRLRATVSAPTR